MASLHEEDDHNSTDERKEYGAEDRYSSEPQKAQLTGAGGPPLFEGRTRFRNHAVISFVIA